MVAQRRDEEPSKGSAKDPASEDVAAIADNVESFRRQVTSPLDAWKARGAAQLAAESIAGKAGTVNDLEKLAGLDKFAGLDTPAIKSLMADSIGLKGVVVDPIGLKGKFGGIGSSGGQFGGIASLGSVRALADQLGERAAISEDMLGNAAC